MRLDLSPWTRAHVSPEQTRELRRAEPRDAVLSVARGAYGWRARVVRRHHLIALSTRRQAPAAAIAEVLAFLAGPALAWCSGCPAPAVIEAKGEAWCASHAEKELAAA